jgi:hypothetical protein
MPVESRSNDKWEAGMIKERTLNKNKMNKKKEMRTKTRAPANIQSKINMKNTIELPRSVKHRGLCQLVVGSYNVKQK